MKTKLQKRNFAKLLKLNKVLNKWEKKLEIMDFRIDVIGYIVVSEGIEELRISIESLEGEC
jgi:hypothetical protein|tara:strand:+ start:353 stop:535 length:183 start_codon:yes stop_codon:yes gene_type:complete